VHRFLERDACGQVVVTRWGSDPMAYGSYSSVAVGALGGEEYDILGESVGGRVFFAGEATSKKHPATMHGAFLSGHREVRAPLLGSHDPVQRRPPLSSRRCQIHHCLLGTCSFVCDVTKHTLTKHNALLAEGSFQGQNRD
jgi:hypothetical protein